MNRMRSPVPGRNAGRDGIDARGSEKRFRAIFELADVGIAEISLDGRWRLINQRLCDILGYREEELCRLSLLEISHPDDVEPHLEKIRALLSGRVGSYAARKRYFRKGGEPVWVDLAVTLVRDREGKPEYFIAVVQDVTWRRKAEEELKESRERFRLLAEAAPVMIWESGPDARCSYFNKQWLDFTGRTLDQEGGDGWTEGVHPDDRDACLATYRAAYAQKRSFSMEYRLRRADGSYAWVDDTGVPRFAPDGTLLGFIGTAHDVTERMRFREELQAANDLLEKRVGERTRELTATIETLQGEIAERIRLADALGAEMAERQRVQNELHEKEILFLQQSRLAAMGEMVGNIAHQWRQPLNILGLLAQDLQMTFSRGELDEPFVQEYVRKTMETIVHMSKTVDDFRSFFLPERERVDFRVLEVVERTLSLLEGSFRARQVRTEVVAVDDPVVCGYPSDFCQVLLNILNNARDAFSASRGDTTAVIRIEVRREGERTAVSVTDNAGGIPEQIIGRIFDPYFTTKPPEEGTGVGLYMSKLIVEGRMNGTLTAENVDGGACFTITV